MSNAVKDPPKRSDKAERERLAAELRLLAERAAASAKNRLSLRQINRLLGRE